MMIQQRKGQSLAEYVVLLALIAIVAVVVVAGVGQATRDRVAQANPSQQEQVIATKTAGVSAAGVGKPGGGNGNSGHNKNLFDD